MMDDSVYHRIICDKSDDLHLPLAFGTDERIHLIDFLDDLRPAFSGEPAHFFLYHRQPGFVFF